MNGKAAPPTPRVLFLLVLLAAVTGMFWYVEDHLVTVYVARLPSGHLFLMEDPSLDALQRLRESEGIDDVVGGGGDDLSRLLALARWVSSQFMPSTPFPDYPAWDAAETLARIRKGETGGFCAQYAIVFGQASQSLGYQVRYVDLAATGWADSHFVPEVFLPTGGRWVVFEPMNGFYNRDGNGIPLSVAELHEFQSGRREGKVYRAPSGEPSPEKEMDLFAYYRYYQRNNFLSVPTYYTVRVVEGGLQWLFEQYAPPCLPRTQQGGGTPDDDYGFSPLFGGERRGVALTVDSFLGAACGSSDYGVGRMKARRAVLDGVVRKMLDPELEFHPLDGDTSWWPVDRSVFPPSSGSGDSPPPVPSI